ncbi:YgaB family protein [Metabacillus fastidiosus]|uniref:YgaB family protein n=1 Tax=Metabacillus fastidiosus TaxID=1458 RepID=UPI002DB728BB|nr:YgaB family protein [Metabacillus fastidiosus]MEC2076716.1 YgaB family protein [Metabacillus fastidiosus]
MERFDLLVSEQLKIMDKLLYLQSEIERCKEIEKQLLILQDDAQLGPVQKEIEIMKKELVEIQQLFEKQTEAVIKSYQRENIETVS